jgi:antitoxin ParD1/3/4
MEPPMTKPMNLNVRLTGALSDFVAGNVGQDGDFDNVSEYVRDLIRRDKARAEAAAFERLKAELDLAFAQPDDSYRVFDADAVIARNRRPVDGQR